MIHNLIASNDPLLSAEIARFDFSNPVVDPVQLAHDLAESMINHRGIGLSANQIGLPYRVFVVNAEPILCMFNPNIVDVSSEKVLLEEGCLSFPNLLMKVKRPKSIKIRYTQPNGETVTNTYTGMTARVILHEYDHMNGIIMHERATGYHKEQALNKLKKFKRSIK